MPQAEVIDRTCMAVTPLLCFAVCQDAMWAAGSLGLVGDRGLTSGWPVLSQVGTAYAEGSAKKFSQWSPGLRNQNLIFPPRGEAYVWHIHKSSCFSWKIFLNVELLFVHSWRDQAQQFPTCQSSIAVIQFRFWNQVVAYLCPRLGKFVECKICSCSLWTKKCRGPEEQQGDGIKCTILFVTALRLDWIHFPCGKKTGRNCFCCHQGGQRAVTLTFHSPLRTWGGTGAPIRNLRKVGMTCYMEFLRWW